MSHKNKVIWTKMSHKNKVRSKLHVIIFKYRGDRGWLHWKKCVKQPWSPLNCFTFKQGGKQIQALALIYSSLGRVFWKGGCGNGKVITVFVLFNAQVLLDAHPLITEMSAEYFFPGKLSNSTWLRLEKGCFENLLHICCKTHVETSRVKWWPLLYPLPPVNPPSRSQPSLHTLRMNVTWPWVLFIYS